MSEIRSWLTVKQAAFIVSRSATQIYAWIEAGKVVTEIDEKGVKMVQHMSLMRAESETKRGRPKTATRR